MPSQRCLLLQVAIEQLQQELSASRREEEVFKDEARKVSSSVQLSLLRNN